MSGTPKVGDRLVTNGGDVVVVRAVHAHCTYEDDPDSDISVRLDDMAALWKPAPLPEPRTVRDVLTDATGSDMPSENYAALGIDPDVVLMVGRIVKARIMVVPVDAAEWLEHFLDAEKEAT